MVSVRFHVNVHPVITAPGSIESSQVVPMKNRGFVPEEGPLLHGFPIAPMFWVKANTLASAEGEFLGGDRLQPTDVEMGVHTRFLAEHFDNVAGTWRPYYTEGLDYYFRSPPGLAPNIEEVEYRLGKEVITVPSLRFNPGDYLISEFNQGRDDASAFAAAMVLLIQPPLGYTVFSTQNDQHEIAVQMNNNVRLFYGNSVSSFPVGVPPTTFVPAYLIVSSNGYSVSSYLASSTKRVYSATASQMALDVPDMKFTIGKTHKGKATGTFNLMEFNLFPHELSATTSPSIYDVIGELSAAYGAS